MGHLCSCHRQTKFDKGQFGSSGISKWKSDTSLMHKLRLRCSYLSATSTRPARGLPQPDDRRPSSSSEVHRHAAVVDRPHPASSPSSPSPTRAATAPPKPPRMRSMLVDGRVEDRKCVDWTTSELDVGSVSSDDVTLSTSFVVDADRTATAGSRGRGRRVGPGPGSRAMSSLLRHMTDLMASSGVRPELLVDFLRRQEVVGCETAAAVRRCVARRAACELIAEVVASRGEVTALCDGLRATGCADIADCLAAVDALLQLTDLCRVRSSTSPSSASVNDFSTQEKSRDCENCCANSDETQPEVGSLLDSSVDVDILHVDPLTGNTIGVNSGDDATSTARANCLKHRSLFIDPETMSLPPQSLGAGACLDRVGGLPVASITFHRVCLFDRLADLLADILLHSRSFRILTFVKCRHVDACLVRFRQNLVSSSRCAGSEFILSRLHVRLSRVDDVTVVSELAAVTSRSLHALSLTGCSIMSPGCEAVVKSIVAGSRCLYELDLGFNDVAEVTSLADALAANCSLRRLRLRGNAIGSDGAAALFNALRRNYRLELLDVSGNPIGERRGGAGGCENLWKVLAETLLSNRTLRELNLERCCLGIDACSALGRALAANTTLRTLDVSMNASIGDVGVALLADGLRCNRRCGIRSLALNMCTVGDAGFRAMLVAIKHGNAAFLRQVKLCYNRIGSKDQSRRLRRLHSGDALRRASLGPRPASALFEASYVHPPSGGSTSAPYWRVGSPLSESEGMMESGQSSTTARQVRQQGSFVVNRRPVSSFDISYNTTVDSASKVTLDREPITPESTRPVNVTFTSGDESEVAHSHDPVSDSDQTGVRQLADSTRGRVPVVMPTVKKLSVTAGSGRAELGRSASAVLDPAGRWSSLDCSGTRSLTQFDAGRELFTPTTDEDSCDVDDDDVVEKLSIYALLCQVLRTNPQMKVLLWGNQQWLSGGGAVPSVSELTEKDIFEPDADDSRMSTEMAFNCLDRNHSTYNTLPRNYELLH